jgi:glucokinase
MVEKNKLSIGVDLGGTKIAAGLCENGNILKKVIFPTKAEAGFESVVKVIVEAVERVCKESETKNINGIGIGSAGQINSSSGEVVFSANLGWRNVPLGKAVSKATGQKTKVINDVRAATVAEQNLGMAGDVKILLIFFLEQVLAQDLY